MRVLCAKLLQCCCPRTWPARDPNAVQRQAKTFLTLQIPLFTSHTPHFTVVLNTLREALPSTTLYYKACTETCSSIYYFALQSLPKYFPVLLCTTKLAQNTFQYYFVLQSLHKTLPSTTLHYKACTKHFSVQLCTTKLAQNTFQYYFVLQSLHKALPSTTVYHKSLQRLLPSSTLYYKACTKHVPVLLCTTKLAQNTFQYYFVLQSLHYFVLQSMHKLLPSTNVYYKSLQGLLPSPTLHYKACT